MSIPNYMDDDLPARVQIVCGDRLVAEVIVHNYWTANSIFAKFMQACYRNGKPLGGAMISRADLPRYWDVPVGGKLP